MRGLAAWAALWAALCGAGILFPPAASARTADCHISNVLISLPVVHGHPQIRASATATCTTRPATFRLRLSILQRMRVGGRLRWETLAYGPADHHIPAPRRRYTLPVSCRRGTFRTKVTVGGYSSSGSPSHQHFYSVPVIVTSCVAGNAASSAPWAATAATGAALAEGRSS